MICRWKRMVDEKGLIKVDLKENLKNNKEEIIGINKTIKEFNDALEAFEDRVKLDNELWDIAKADFRVLKPNWAYEQSDKYLNTLLSFKQNIQDDKNKQAEVEVFRRKRQVNSMKEQITALEKSVVKLEKEIGEEK